MRYRGKIVKIGNHKAALTPNNVRLTLQENLIDHYHGLNMDTKAIDDTGCNKGWKSMKNILITGGNRYDTGR